MLQSFEFKAGGETYTVCYTARARFLFEERAKYPLIELRSFRPGAALSDVELAYLVLAGLEGERHRSKSRKAAWTLDEVLDDVLGDADADERLAILSVCIDGIGAAFRRASDAAPAEAATGAEGKPQTTV